MTSQPDNSRREFLGALGAGIAAGTLATTEPAAAQGTAMKIVDFHNHYMGPGWSLTNLANLPPAARPAWEAINRNLQSPDNLLASVDEAGLAARVINTPTAFIEDADGKVPAGTVTRINDQMAATVARRSRPPPRSACRCSSIR